MQHPTAAAASLQLVLRHGAGSPFSILRAMFAQSAGWEPGARAASPSQNHNLCPSCQALQRFQVSSPVQERCCWTTVRLLRDGCCRQQPARKRYRSLLEKSPASPLQETPAFYFTPRRPSGKSYERQHLFASQKHPKSRAAALLNRLPRNKSTRATGPKPTLARRAEPSSGHPTPAPQAAPPPSGSSPARETAASGAANINKLTCERQREKKLREETIFGSTFPRRILSITPRAGLFYLF